MEMLTVAIEPRLSAYLVLTEVAVLILCKPMTGDRLLSQQLGMLGALAQSSRDRAEHVRAVGQPRLNLQDVKGIIECSAAEVPREFSSHPKWPRVGGSVSVSLYLKALTRRRSTRR